MASERASLKDQEPRDVMSWLLKAKEDGDPSAPPGDQAIEEDARLLIIAGRYVALPCFLATMFVC